MSTASSQSQLAFIQKESSYATIPNSGGTASVANGDAIRIITLDTKGEVGQVERPSKTATLSRTTGIIGKKAGSWSASVEMAGSGSAGTKPDMDELLEAAFGKAATVSAGVSVTYGLEDDQVAASPSLSIWNFRDPATMEQMVAFGAVVAQMKFNITQERASIDFSGPCRYVTPKDGFAGLDSTAKAGLSAFPTRPASPTYNGTMALGLYGSATLDGTAYTTLRSLSISADMARSLDDSVLFNGAYSGSPRQGTRNVTVEFELTDDDSAAIQSLKSKARAKTAMDLVFVVGTTAGNIWTITLKNVQLTSPDYNDSQANWGVRFTGTAHGSSATSKDELALVLT